jgi:hypothetical protein
MTLYRPNRFTLADAAPLVGKIADITQLADSEGERHRIREGARIIGCDAAAGGWLTIEDNGSRLVRPGHTAAMTRRPREGFQKLAFWAITEVANVRDPEPVSHCALCGITAVPSALERFNAGPGLACKDVGACQVRQIIGPLTRPLADRMALAGDALTSLATADAEGTPLSVVASALRAVAAAVSGMAAECDPQ